MMILGIDPGVTGAIAITVNGRLHDVRDIPVRQEGSGTVKRRVDSAGLASIIREWRAQLGPDAELAIVERVAAMPAQGVSSVFSLGHTAGAVEGVLLAMGCPIEFVAPASWKRALGLGRDKADSRAKASLTFPEHAGLWTRKCQHNRAESVLLAHYGWRRFA